MLPKIEGYEVIEKIGEGGMALVYRARHERLDRDVALKVLNSDRGSDPTFTERFIREAQIAAKLVHPNIVQIHDVNNSNGNLYLSMELINGGSMLSELSRPCSPNELNPVLKQLCSALDHAHRLGYVHRDIKPANILFRENSSLALSDFGISKAISGDANITTTGMVIGTPSYMSPEQVQGLKVDSRSDLYSVGVLAFYYLVGELPYTSESVMSVALKHVSEPIPILPSDIQNYQMFFDIALAKSPNDRFDSAQELFECFQELADKEGPRALEETLVKQNSDLAQSSSELDTARSGLSELEANKAKMSTQSPARRSRYWPVVFLMFGLFVVAASFLILWLSNQHSSANKADIDSTALTSGNTPAISNLSREQKLRIAQLLTQAEVDLSKGNLIYPISENAYEKYLAILDISPNDQAALEGINRVSKSLAGLISNYIAAGDYEKARFELDKLQALNPEYSEIELLEMSMAMQRATADTVNMLQDQSESNLSKGENPPQYYESAEFKALSLMEQAEFTHRAGDMYQPKHNNAADLYQRVLSKDPSNSEARKQLATILDILEADAEAALANKEFARAQKLISKISVLDANQERFFRLQYALNNLKEAANSD